MQLTLEERERRAYIEGRTEEAALLQQAIDVENDAIDEMRHERDMAQAEADDFAKRTEALEESLEQAESKVQTLEGELKKAHDEVKDLRQQIHAAGVDLL